MTICRAIGIACLGLSLSGCSVVVFEDSTACPAIAANCAVTTSIPDGNDDVATDMVAENEPPETTLPAPFFEPVFKTITAPDINGHTSYFDYDSAILSKKALAGLVFVADHLKTNPTQNIVIEGHCDQRGTRDYNLALGAKRAQAVGNVLAKAGVDTRQFRTISFGKERPAVLVNSPEAWAANRRTIIQFAEPLQVPPVKPVN